MRLLFRFGIFAILFGFIAGLLARRALGTKRIPEMLLVSLLPWFVHLFYVLRRAVRIGGFGIDVVIVGVLSFAVATGLLLLAPRVYRPYPPRVALVPVALAALHGAILLAWASTLPFGLSTTLASVGFAWSTLFFFTGLWAYTLPSPRLPKVSDLGRRR